MAIRQLREDQGYLDGYRYDAKAKTLTGRVVVMRTGVLPYEDGKGGFRMELKHPSDFFSSSFLNSIPGKPVTDGHPHANGQPKMLTLEDLPVYSKGIIHDDVRVDEPYVIATVTVIAPTLIQEILDGKKQEVSTGLFTDVVEERGVYGGASATNSGLAAEGLPGSKRTRSTFLTD